MNELNTDLFRMAGETLYGDRWQSDIARLLNVNDRTVRYWASGKFSPPFPVWAEIAAELNRRSVSAAMLAANIATLM